MIVIEPYFVCPYCGKESHDEGMACCGEAGHAELKYLDIDGKEYTRQEYEAWKDMCAYYEPIVDEEAQ